MILNKIFLKNFKSYNGENEFLFSEGLNIISGSVGSGKTSLFEAFQWLIESRQDEFVDSEFILNKAYENEAISRGETSLEVEVKLTCQNKDSDGIDKEFILSKKMLFNKMKDDLFPKEPEFLLEYVDEITGSTMTDDNPGSVIRRIKSEFFPQNIREYILFKGENLNSLIDFKNSDTLRNAVDRISYLKYYERIYESVKKLKSKIETKVRTNLQADNKNKKAFNEAKSNLLEFERNLKDYEERLTRTNTEIKELSEERDKYVSIMTNLGKYPELKEKLSSIQKQRTFALGTGDVLSEQLRTSFLKDWMLYGFDDVLANCEKIFQDFNDEKNKKLDEGRTALRMGIPGDALINKMLIENNCNICGRDFEPNSKEQKTVESHLDKNKKTLDDLLSEDERFLDKRINDLYSSIPSIKTKQSDSKISFDNYNKKIYDNTKAIEELKQQEDLVRNDIGTMLKKNGGLEDIDSDRVEHRFNTIDRELQTKRSTFDSIKRNIDIIKSNIIKAKKDLEKNSSNSDDISQTDESKTLRYIEVLEKITSDQISLEKINFIEQIESQANKIQESIIKNPNLVVLYSKIDRDNYTIDFEDKNGNPNPGHGAQIDLAKLSIISSVLKLSSSKSNEVFPFIVDAPASAFDDTIYKPFVESLSKNFTQSIVILKDIDKDINYYVEQNYTNKIYQLSKNLMSEDGASMTSSITNIKKLK
jgi:DNA sulfur modification protein DndD